MDNQNGVGLLKGQRSYANPYEGAYKQMASDINFNGQTWMDAIKNGKADIYLSLLEQNKGKVLSANFYDEKYYNFERQMLELYRNVADNTSLDDMEDGTTRERFQNVYNPKTDAWDQVSLGKMTDQAYIDYQLNQIDQERTAEIVRAQELHQKEMMNWLEKTGSAVASVSGELAEGAVSGVTTVVDSVLAIGAGAIGAWSDGAGGTKFSDAYVDYFTKGLTAIEKEGFRTALDEYERKYSFMKDIDGNITTSGKWIGGIANSIGMMAPSAALAIATGGASLVGIPYAEAFFAVGIYGNNMYENATNPELIGTPSYLKMINAGVKAGIETAIEMSLSKFLGATFGDQITKGLLSNPAVLKKQMTNLVKNGAKSAAIGKLLTDAAHEGLEEFLQDMSTNFVDLGMSLFYEGYGNTGVNLQTLCDSFLMGAVTSLVLAGAHISGGEAISLANKTKAGSKVVDAHNKLVANVKERTGINGRLWGQEVGIEVDGEYKELHGLSKWYYQNLIGDLQSNIDTLKEQGITDSNREEALNLYNALNTLSDFYSSFDASRLERANNLLSKAMSYDNVSAVNAGQKVLAYQNFGKELDDVLGDMLGGSKARTAIIKAVALKHEQELKDADVTSINAVYEDVGDIDGDFTTDELEKITDLLDGHDQVVITDGHTAVEEDGVVFVSAEWLKNYKESDIYKFLNNTQTIDYILNLKEYNGLVSDILKYCKEFTGNKKMTREEALMNLLFNEQVATGFILSDGDKIHKHANTLFTILGVIKEHSNDSKWFKQKFNGKQSEKRMNLARQTYEAIAKTMRGPVLKAILNWRFDIDTFGPGITDVLTDADFAELKKKQVKSENLDNVGTSQHKYLVGEYIDGFETAISELEEVVKNLGTDTDRGQPYAEQKALYEEILEKLKAYKDNPKSLSKDELTEMRLILDSADVRGFNFGRMRKEYEDRQGWLDKAFTISASSFSVNSKADIQYLHDAERAVFKKITYGTTMFRMLDMENNGDLSALLRKLEEPKNLDTLYRYLLEGRPSSLTDADGNIVPKENFVSHVLDLLQRQLGDRFFVSPMREIDPYDNVRTIGYNVHSVVPAKDFFRPEILEVLGLDETYDEEDVDFAIQDLFHAPADELKTQLTEDLYVAAGYAISRYKRGISETQEGPVTVHVEHDILSFTYPEIGLYDEELVDRNTGEFVTTRTPIETIQRMIENRLDAVRCVKLSEIFDFSALSFPFSFVSDAKETLNNVIAYDVPYIVGASGDYNPGTNIIRIGTTRYYETLLHEVQHAIQEVTHTEGGYNTDRFSAVYDNKYLEHVYFNYPLLIKFLIQSSANYTTEVKNASEELYKQGKFDDTKTEAILADNPSLCNTIRLAGYMLNEGEIEARAYTHNRPVSGMSHNGKILTLDDNVFTSLLDAHTAEVLKSVYKQQDLDKNYKTVHTRIGHKNTLRGNADLSREVLKNIVSSTSPMPLSMLTIDMIIKSPKKYLAQEVLDTFGKDFSEGNAYYRVKDYIENLDMGISIDRTADTHKYILVDDMAFSDLLLPDIKKAIDENSTRLLDKFNEEGGIDLSEVFSKSQLEAIGIKPDIYVSFDPDDSNSETNSDGVGIDVTIGTKKVKNDKQLLMDILHEFRHVVQFAHGFESGFTTDIKMPKGLIEEVKNHVPELFENVDKIFKRGKNWEEDYVKHLVYISTSGELNAYGIENSMLHTKPVFYNTVGNDVELFLPWYNAKTREGVWTIKNANSSKKVSSQKVDTPKSTLTKEELMIRLAKRVYEGNLVKDLKNMPKAFQQDYQAFRKEYRSKATKEEKEAFYKSLPQETRNEIASFEERSRQARSEFLYKLQGLDRETILKEFGHLLKTESPDSTKEVKKTKKKATPEQIKEAKAKELAEAAENDKKLRGVARDKELARMMLGMADEDRKFVKGEKFVADKSELPPRYLTKESVGNSNLKYFWDAGVRHLDPEVQVFVKNVDLDKVSDVVAKSIKNATLTKQRLNKYIREATPNTMNDYTFKMINKTIFKNEFLSSLSELDALCTNGMYFGYIGAMNKWPLEFMSYIQNNDLEGAVDLINRTPMYRRYAEKQAGYFGIANLKSGMKPVPNEKGELIPTFVKEGDVVSNKLYEYIRVQMWRYFRGDLKSAAYAFANARQVFNTYEYHEGQKKSLDESTGGDTGMWVDKEGSVVDNISEAQGKAAFKGSGMRDIGNSIIKAYEEEVAEVAKPEALNDIQMKLVLRLNQLRAEEFAKSIPAKAREEFLRASNVGSEEFYKVMQSKYDDLDEVGTIVKKALASFSEKFMSEVINVRAIIDPTVLYEKYQEVVDADFFGTKKEQKKVTDSISDIQEDKKSRKNFSIMIRKRGDTILKRLNSGEVRINEIPEAKEFFKKVGSTWVMKDTAYKVGVRGRAAVKGPTSVKGLNYIQKTDIGFDEDVYKHIEELARVRENYVKIVDIGDKIKTIQTNKKLAQKESDRILRNIEKERAKLARETEKAKADIEKNAKQYATTVGGKTSKSVPKGSKVQNSYNVVSDMPMPKIVKDLLDTSFDRYRDTLVKFVSRDKNTGEVLTDTNEKDFSSMVQHMVNKYDAFYEANASLFTSMSYSDVLDILNYYESEPVIVGAQDANAKMQVFRIFTLATINDLDRTGAAGWHLSKDDRKRLERNIEGKGSESGMVLQAFSQVRGKLNPVKTIIAKSLASYGISDEDIEALVSRTNSLLHATSAEGSKEAAVNLNDELNRIYAQMKYDEIANIDAEVEEFEELWQNKYKEAQEANDGTAIRKLEQQRETYLKGVKKRKKNVDKKVFWRKLKTLRVTGMLSSPTTWMRNLVSNVAVDKLNAGSDIVAKTLLSKKAYRKGQWDLSKVQVTDEVKHFIDEYITNNDVISRLYDTTTKYDDRVNSSGNIKENIFVTMLEQAIRQKYAAEHRFDNATLQWYSTMITKMISDKRFIEKSAKKYFAKILTLEVEAGNVSLNTGLNNKILNLFAEAVIEANEEYMHKTSFIGKLIQETKDTHPVFYEAMTLWQPFLNSSINWYGEMIKYSPVGLASSIYKLAKLEKQIQLREERRGKGEILADSRLSEYLTRRDIGKGVIGTLLLSLGMILKFAGLIRIKDDDDKSYLYIADKKIDISGIFGTSSLLIGASLAQTFDNSDNKSALDIMEITVSEFVEGFMLNDILERHKWDDSFFDAMIVEGENFFKSFVPQIVQLSVRTFNNEKIKYSAGFLGAWERYVNSFVPTQPMGHRVANIYTGEIESKYTIPVLGELLKSGIAGAKIYLTPITEQEKFVRSYDVNKNLLTGELTANNKTYTLDKMKLNQKYGELNSDIQAITEQRHYVQMPDGSYRTLSWDKMSTLQKTRVIERTMRKNAEYAKIYVWVSSGHKYYADDETYKALRALGIKSNVYRGDKGYVE